MRLAELLLAVILAIASSTEGPKVAYSVDQFMAAISGQESGGDYNATNGDSGAHGRFQIMPANWPSWSREAGLGPDAPQTPENQDKVARFKMQQYYERFGNWEDVAAAWYSGQPRDPETLDRPQNGYPTIRQYVDSVMGRLSGQPSGGASTGSSVSTGQTAASAPGSSISSEDLTRIREETNRAILDWFEGGSDPDEYIERIEPMLRVLETYETNYGGPTLHDKEQQDFQNWAEIEGIKEREAAQAFNRWNVKQGIASDAAKTEMDYYSGKNAEQAELQETRNQSSTPGLLPQPTGVTYGDADVGALLDKWKKRVGVGDEPVAYTASSAPGVDAGGPTTPSVPTSPSSVKQDPFATFRDEQAGVRPDSPAGQLPEGIQPGTDMTPPRSDPKKGDNGGFLANYHDEILANQGKSKNNPVTVGKRAGRWFKKRFLAEGGHNLEGGRAVVGERGPELYAVPGFGTKVVGRNGPEEIDIIEGSSVIPADEAYQYHRIKQGVGQPSPKAWQPRQPGSVPTEEVMEAVRTALAGHYAVNPPVTPMLYGGAELGKDLWEPWRQLTGIPAVQPQPEVK